MTVICCLCCCPLSRSLHLTWALLSQINGSMSPECCKEAAPSTDVSQSDLGLGDSRSTWTAELEARESSRWQPGKELLALNYFFHWSEHKAVPLRKKLRATEKHRGVWELVTLVCWILLVMLRNIIKKFLFCLLWKKKTKVKNKL